MNGDPENNNDENNAQAHAEPEPAPLPVAFPALEGLEIGDNEDGEEEVVLAELLGAFQMEALVWQRRHRRLAAAGAVVDPPPNALEQQNNEENPNPMLFRFANLRGRNIETISPYLYDMIREGHTCTQVLGGWSQQQRGCNRVLEHISSHPDEAFYAGAHGRTVLHEACLRGSCGHVIRALIAANSHGATDRDVYGNSPLHLLFVDYSTQISSIHPHQEIEAITADLLDVNPSFLAAATNIEGNTALHMACTAPESMVPQNTLLQLLEANPAAATKLNVRNQSPLRLHCQRRNASAQVARILYEANPHALTTLDSTDGWAPLHCAAANINLNLIDFLVNVDPGEASIKTSKGENALHLICRQNLGAEQIPTLEILLRGCPDSLTQRESQHFYTPLHLLCTTGSRVNLEALQKILDANHEAASVADAEHYLPLHHACENGCDATVIAAILRSYPSAAYSMTRKQDSALSLACACNKSVETVQILIEANAEALVKRNDYGFAPLHCVCRAYQPRMGIVQALLDACPSSVTLKTHGGETPIHLASGNTGAFVGVLQLLTMAQNKFRPGPGNDTQSDLTRRLPLTNKVGNTPLHDACFRGSPFEHIETLAMANPEWIMVRNNAGYTPFQILCKNGRIDERTVTAFSRLGGPEIFSVMDSTGNTPLHSVMRGDVDLATLKSLIRAFPDALQHKTVYGDSPLHLACLRRADPEVVREVALASSSNCHSPILEPNTAGQTPIGIAMEEFRSLCRGRYFCCVLSDYRPEQEKVFRILSALVKILYYGPVYKDLKQLSLVRACVSLHRQGVRLDPTFIRRAIHIFPEEVRVMDEEGNYPLHIEASIPIEKMFLLDGSSGCCGGECHTRIGLLRVLLEVYPAATECRNSFGHFPLNLMLQNGRLWGREVAVALRAFPPALHWHKGLDDRVLSIILEKASKECGVDTLFSLLISRPDIFRRRRSQELQCQPI